MCILFYIQKVRLFFGHTVYDTKNALFYSVKAKNRKHRNVFLSDVRLIRPEPICQAFLLC